ncbi:DUF4831 family protein [Saccharicrinis aurantiacus]|uniref:DUF4831 family protein n=1 Tax=Saccharicrinis aurantiacus TaxID=1849719 RepID=UPI00094F8937|nr:DUF4831 family protein [Saccharicrinis aurantiacus]
MHKYIKTLFIGASVAFFVSCSVPQEVVSKVNITSTNSIDDATSQSLSYTLPKSIIQVDIVTEKVIQKAGPFYRYSQRFLNLNNVITQDNEEWHIKSVKVYTKGIADENKRYSITTEGNSSADHINLTKDGVLRGFNNPAEPKTTAPCKKQEEIPHLEDITFNEVELTEDILLKTSSTAMAQETANMIYNIRANRFDILSGNIDNTPADGIAYQQVLNRFDQMEKDFVSMFAGKTIKASKTQSFSFAPSQEGGNAVLCRFSKSNGIVDAMDLSGTPIYIKIDRADFKKLENNKVVDPKKEDVVLRNGIYYCLPGSANVKIVDKNIELLSQDLKIAQYGQVVSMPSSILEKEGTVVKICPTTGALIQISDK